MKKILSLVLVISLIFVFTACGKDEKLEVEQVNIKTDVEQGVIPECKFKLGDSVSKIEDTLTKELDEAPLDDHGHPEYVFEKFQMANYNCIDNGDFKYYYLKDETKVSYIVSFTNAFGFRLGEVSVAVEMALEEFAPSITPISKENAFFLPGMPEGEVYTYTFGTKNVMFVFENNALCATAIYDNTIWK